MEQILFKEKDEVLVLKGFRFPFSVEEIIHYLRVISNQLEEDLK